MTSTMEPNLLEQMPDAKTSRWKIEKREVQHKNAWYEYRHDAGVTDHGKPFDYYYVYKGAGSAGIVALTDDNKLILVRQYRYLAGKDMLEIPGGSIVGATNREEMAKRELLEETGYEAEEMKLLNELDYAVGYSVDKIGIFFARGCQKKSEQTLDETEHGLRIELYDISEVYRLIEAGEITNTATISALAIARPHLLKGA